MMQRAIWQFLPAETIISLSKDGKNRLKILQFPRKTSAATRQRRNIMPQININTLYCFFCRCWKCAFRGRSHPNIQSIRLYNTALLWERHQPFAELFRLLYSGLPCALLFGAAIGLPWSWYRRFPAFQSVAYILKTNIAHPALLLNSRWPVGHCSADFPKHYTLL